MFLPSTSSYLPTTSGHPLVHHFCLLARCRVHKVCTCSSQLCNVQCYTPFSPIFFSSSLSSGGKKLNAGYSFLKSFLILIPLLRYSRTCTVIPSLPLLSGQWHDCAPTLLLLIMQTPFHLQSAQIFCQVPPLSSLSPINWPRRQSTRLTPSFVSDVRLHIR